MSEDIKTALETPTAYKWAGMLLRPEETVAYHRTNGEAHTTTPGGTKAAMKAAGMPAEVIRPGASPPDAVGVPVLWGGEDVNVGL